MTRPLLILSVCGVLFASCGSNTTSSSSTTTDSTQTAMPAQSQGAGSPDTFKNGGASSTQTTTTSTTTSSAGTTADTSIPVTINGSEASAGGTNGGTAPGGRSFYKGNKHKLHASGSEFRAKYPGEFPEGSARPLTDKDVMYLSEWGLKVIQNEIYARHGMRFTDPDLQSHFNRQGWYHATGDDVSGKLSSTERRNIAFIKNYKFSPNIPE